MQIINRGKHFVASYLPLAHLQRSKKVRQRVAATYGFADDLIAGVIDLGKPALIGRLGATEARVIGCYLDIVKLRNWYDPFATFYSLITIRRRLKQLKNGAGFYPATFKTFLKFSKLYLDAYVESDLLACWGMPFTWSESEALKITGLEIIHHHATAPWVNPYVGSTSSLKPWTTTLNDKKILIVSGFADTLRDQHAIIKNVFPFANYPNFQATFLKAPLSQGGLKDVKDSFTHLDSLFEEIKRTNFDILLVSAGSYSMPIAHFAKKIGKIGIHCGGELQLFFGVLGGRWDSNPKLLPYVNEYWTRPSENEKPKNWKSIENGSYW